MHILWEKTVELWGVRYGVGFGEGIYERHGEIVRREVESKGGRLLVWNVEEGWPRLCEFLGVEVPKREFPLLDEEEEMREFVDKCCWNALLVWLCVLAAIGWVLFLVSNSDG